jgi:hypothetical protein
MWNAAVIGVLVTAIPAGPREDKTNADDPAPTAAPKEPKEGEHVGRSSH